MLRVLTAIFVAVAAWFLIRPARVPDAEVGPAGLDAPPAASAPDATADPAVAEAVARANIFADSRTPPAVRYNPFEPEPAAEADMQSAAGAAGAADAAVPRLFGTILGPGGPLALMRLDPAVPDAQLYREGDRAGRYRVVTIAEQSVVLDTSEGRIVLRLTRSEASSP